MSCRTCAKDICYRVPVLNQDEDFIHLTASEYMQTSQIRDACGNPRINLGCTLGECSEADPVVQFKYIPDDRIITINKVKTGNQLFDFNPCDCTALPSFQVVDDNNNPLFYFLTDEYVDPIPTTLVECKVITGTCLDNCIEMLSDICVDGDISADKVVAEQLFGNGCGVTNTDDTQPVELIYTKGTTYLDDTLKLTFENKKNCAGYTPSLLETPELDISDFTHNTTNISMILTDDNLVITDSDNNTIDVDLSKYNNRQEQYIKPGNYEPDDDAKVTIPYQNTDDPYSGNERVVLDFSEAFNNMSLKNVEYNPCTGELSLINAKGDVFIVSGTLPTNIHKNGELVINDAQWSIGGDNASHIYYQTSNEVITVNFQLKKKDTAKALIRQQNFAQLPITLSKNTYVWIVGTSGAGTDERIGHIQIKIATDGWMSIQSAIDMNGDRIFDTFTLVADTYTGSCI